MTDIKDDHRESGDSVCSIEPSMMACKDSKSKQSSGGGDKNIGTTTRK